MAKYKEHMRSIIEKGFARPNRFNVIIELPSVLVEPPRNSVGNVIIDEVSNRSNFFKKGAELVRDILGKSGLTRNISLSTEQTELPGKNLSTVDIKYNGDYFKLPYGQVYSVHPFTFRVSQDMYEKTIIDQWMNTIYNPELHVLGYYDDIVSRVTIEQLDLNDNVVESIILYDAFPIVVNPLVLSDADNNSIHKLFVQFAYKKWGKTEDEATGGLYGALAQTPLGPFVSPILSNPLVQRGLEVLEKQTGLDLEGEAVDIYNQVDSVVRNTTGASINESVNVLNKVKVDLDMNTRVSIPNKNTITGVVDKVLSRW